MNLGFGELIVIVVIAFVVVGPEDLPKIARAIGKAVRQFKGLYAGVKSELNLDAELTQISKQVQNPLSVAGDLANICQEIEKINVK